MEGTSSTGRKSEFSQKGEFADALRWERFTDLKVRVGEAILNFLLQSGKDTGGEMFLDERAEKWKETKVSKAEFRRFADNQKLCSSRYVRMVMRNLIDLGFAKPFMRQRRLRRHGRKFVITARTGYGLDVEAMKRHRNSLNRCKKFMEPLLIREDDEDDAKSVFGKETKRRGS